MAAVDPTSAESPLHPAVERVANAAPGFARQPVQNKLAWLTQMRSAAARLSREWAELSCKHKRLSMSSPAAAEAWFNGPVATLRSLRLTSQALEDIVRHGKPSLPGLPRELDNGQVSVPVFPANMYDRAMLPGVSAEVLLAAGTPVDGVSQATFYRQASPQGGVALILGAGNVSSIPILDAVHKLFVEGQAVVLKLNPVNEYVGPIIEQILKPLIDQSYAAVVYGDAEVGARLCRDPRITSLHLTGSDRTHDTIVWGSDPRERERRKAENTPLFEKPVSSELGNISPVCVVPGPYTDKQLRATAESIAGMVAQNASFNCIAAKMLILPRGWDGGQRLLEALREELRQLPPRYAYYPGAKERFQALTREAPHVETFGEPQEGELPWALITELDCQKADTLHFRMEPFAPVLSVVELDASEPGRFLAHARDFCNDVLWGTLSAMLVVHPSQLEDATVKPDLDQCIRSLRYGSVAVNQWSGVAYHLGTTPWGGHPSSTPTDIQSGLGFVHNALMLENVDKSVVRGPLVGPLRPLWSARHRKAHIIAERMAALEADPSPWRLSKLGLGALGS